MCNTPVEVQFTSAGCLNYPRRTPGVTIGLITVNPATGVKKFKNQGEGIPVWTEDEVQRFQRRHASGSKARLALELLVCTAQRRADVVKLGWQSVRQTEDGDAFAVRQEKTGQTLLIPLHPDLASELVLLPMTNMTFITMENGKPYTPKAFSEWFRARCNEAGLPHRSAHGLRKLAATRLADVGCSGPEIMAHTGHKSLAEVERYIKAANQAKLARQAQARLLGAAQTVTRIYPKLVPSLPQR
jgi:integrase